MLKRSSWKQPAAKITVSPERGKFQGLREIPDSSARMPLPCGIQWLRLPAAVRFQRQDAAATETPPAGSVPAGGVEPFRSVPSPARADQVIDAMLSMVALLPPGPVILITI